MSQIAQSRCAKGAEISNAGAFARHADACDTCERGETDGEPAENGGFRASDMEMDEIPAATGRASDRELAATCDLHGHEPADADSLRSAAAKALIRAKSGGRDAYATVFGSCPTDGCTYGRNGFAATHCREHGPEAETGESEPETDDYGGFEFGEDRADTPERESADTGESAEREAGNRAAYVAQLLENGVSPIAAEEAANARFA